MKSFWNKLIQILGTTASVGAVYFDFLPPKAKLAVVGIAATSQLISGVVAHRYNPDGTPASVAYAPSSSKVRPPQGDY